MAESNTLIVALTFGLFGFILLVNIPGLGIGRWVAHFGTTVTLVVTAMLVALLFVHPHATPTHPAPIATTAVLIRVPHHDHDESQSLQQNHLQFFDWA